MFDLVAGPSLTPFGLRYQVVTSCSPTRSGSARLISRARRLARAGKAVAWTLFQMVAARCSKVGRSGAVAAEISPDPRYRFWVITVSLGAGRAPAAGARARARAAARITTGSGFLTRPLSAASQALLDRPVDELGGAAPGEPLRPLEAPAVGALVAHGVEQGGGEGTPVGGVHQAGGGPAGLREG